MPGCESESTATSADQNGGGSSDDMAARGALAATLVTGAAPTPGQLPDETAHRRIRYTIELLAAAKRSSA